MDGTLAEIRLFSGTFNPRMWAFCQGQLAAISENTALFSLLGTNFGGDGRTTFGYPDLRGRVAMGTGAGPGLTTSMLGEQVGFEEQWLALSNMPAHTHAASFTQTAGTVTDISATAETEVKMKVATEANSTSPTNAFLAELKSTTDGDPVTTMGYTSVDPGAGKYLDSQAFSAETKIVGTPSGQVAVQGAVALQDTGSGTLFSIMQPTFSLQYIICIDGLYPARN